MDRSSRSVNVPGEGEFPDRRADLPPLRAGEADRDPLLDVLLQRVAGGWSVSDDADARRIPAKAWTLRLAAATLTIESVTALRAALASVGSPPHVVIDLRSVGEMEPAAGEALIVLERFLREERGSGLTVRVRTAAQLAPLEPIWHHVVIG